MGREGREDKTEQKDRKEALDWFIFDKWQAVLIKINHNQISEVKMVALHFYSSKGVNKKIDAVIVLFVGIFWN